MEPASRFKTSRTAVLVVLILFAFVGGFIAGKGTDRIASGGTVLTGAPSGVDFAPVWKAWNLIDEKFVPAAVASTTATTTAAEAEQARVWGMIQGMAASLGDPYTYFLPPTEAAQFEEDISGSFEGVGMEIAIRDQILTVVSPLRGTPAERAGLRSGDRILKIDGKTTRNLDIGAAVSQIRGPEGTEVVFTVSREGENTTRDIRVTRAVINIPTIETSLRADGIFVIELYNFSAQSPDLFRQALREFIESGSSKLILDLRGNPGGYLEASVDMASWFLPAGKVVVTEDYGDSGKKLSHRSRGYDVFNDNLKMVVITDRGSASASEILAGALSYHKVAQLVGSKTFGKGSVQELIDITPETSLKITVARWLTPSGAPIPLDGIVPDVEVELTDEDREAGRDPQLQKAVELLNSN